MRGPVRLPESLDAAEVAAFISDLGTHRDRAIALAMLLGGLRSLEVRSLRLADIDMGLKRLRVSGKGGHERVVPVDGAFFTEPAAYLRSERPAGLAAPGCFVALRGPTAGRPLTEAGLRRIFRTQVEPRLIAFERRYEATPKPFEWKFTRSDLARLTRRIADKEALRPAA